jgi:hypothetical protein
MHANEVSRLELDVSRRSDIGQHRSHGASPARPAADKEKVHVDGCISFIELVELSTAASMHAAAR